MSTRSNPLKIVVFFIKKYQLFSNGEHKVVSIVGVGDSAVAALQDNGRVITWGNIVGGRPFSVDAKNSTTGSPGAKKIISGNYGVVALLHNGNVAVSDSIDRNRHFNAIRSQLHDVVDIMFDATTGEYIAIRNDDTDVRWQEI